MAILNKLGIEIPILIIFYCFMVSDYVTTNFVIFRTCYITMGYNESDCALLGTDNENATIKELEKKVQTKASIILMTKTIFDAIIPIFCSLIIGPWSNKHGRKPVLISSLTGYFLGYIAVIVVSVLPLSPWWWIISCIVSSLGGGICSLLTASFCYIVDITSEENRGIRMSLLEMMFGIGSVLGTMSSSYIFHAIGYVGIYSLCAILTLCSILYTIFLLRESVAVVEQQNRCKDLFDMSVISKTIKACFKPRPNKDRLLLNLLMLTLIIYIFVIFSDSSMFFLWVRNQFNWSLKKYTLYAGICSVVDILATAFLLIVVYKMLKVTDMTIILIGFIGLVSSSLMWGFAKQEWLIYLGSGVKRLNAIISPLTRSAISKLLPPDDLGTGHIFAVITSVETIVQLISSPVYTLFYNNTMNILPSAYNFLSAGIYSLDIFFVSAVIIIRRLNPNPDIRVIYDQPS